MKIGDKVVCIKRGKWSGQPEEGVVFPKFNQELIVREVVFISGGYCLLFEEIRNPIKHYFPFTDEVHFCEIRFRKIDEHNFTNSLTEKLAREAMKEVKEYIPLEVDYLTTENN